MADNVIANLGAGGATFATDNIGGIQYPRTKVAFGVAGAAADVSAADPLPVVWQSAVVSATQSGAWNITNITGTITLPTGAATGAKQDTGNTSLASIDGKLPALGQALAAASVPVVLTAAQISTLTPFSSITANAGTNLNTSLLALEAGNLATIAGKDFATQTTLALVKAKTDNLDVATSTRLAETTFTTRFPVQGQAAMAASVPVVIASNQSAVAVSAASLPLPTGASTETTLALVSTEATLAAIKAILNISQGAVGTATGPMVQALVSDTPESYLNDTIRPLSVTSEGRLRVSTLPANLDISFFSDDLPSLVGDPPFNRSPWAPSIW